MHFSSITTLALLAYTSLTTASTCNKTPSSDNPSPNTLAIYTPGQNQIVPVDRPFTITWDPTAGITSVSIVLLVGPSTNVVPLSCIINSTPNTGTFIWTPPSDLTPTGNSGYGLQIIDDATGKFQYSTQFGVSNPEVSSSSSSSTSTSSSATGKEAATQLSDGQVQIPTSTSVPTHTTTKPHPSLSLSASSILVILPSTHSKNTTTTTTKPHPSSHHKYTSKPPHIGTGIISSGGAVKNSTHFITPTASLTKPSSLGPVTSVVVAQTSGTVVGVGSTSAASAPAPASTTRKSAAAGERRVVQWGLEMVVGLGALVAVFL